MCVEVHSEKIRGAEKANKLREDAGGITVSPGTGAHHALSCANLLSLII